MEENKEEVLQSTDEVQSTEEVQSTDEVQSTNEVQNIEEDVVQEQAAVTEVKKKKIQAGTVCKVFFLVYQICVIVVLAAALALLLIPNAKIKLLQTPLGKYLTKMTITEEVYKNIYDIEFREEEIVRNEDVDIEMQEEYINIALFGLDSRHQSLDSTNSDTIMIVSIGKESKAVKLVSIYRDSYQKIYDETSQKYNKINSAYAYGGAEGAINTLNMNFDLDIKDYVAVNFNGLATIIDLLGGVDVNITDMERFYINGYLTETREITGLNASDIYQSGNVHLNGLQATAYCRIRYTSVTLPDGTTYNNDFGRTARQRLVLTQMIDKAKNMGFGQVKSLCNEVFKEENDIFKTSLSYDEVMDLLPIILEFSLESTSGYPFTYDPNVMINSLSNVVVAGHSYNVTKLHQYLFGDYDYKPSKTVLKIEEEIKDLTGVGTQLTEEDKEREQQEAEEKEKEEESEETEEKKETPAETEEEETEEESEEAEEETTGKPERDSEGINQE